MIAVCVVLGIFLLLLEMILPGMIAGILGVGLIVFGNVSAFRDYDTAIGTYTIFGTIFALLVLGAGWFKFLPRSFIGKWLISVRSIDGVSGEELPSDLVGKEGVSETRLYTSGKVRVEGVLYDAMTNGEGIEAGVPIKIVQVEGVKIVVAEVKPSK